MTKKELRIRVWEKYGKRCAYCGKEIEYRQLQVDHIEPVHRSIYYVRDDKGFQVLNEYYQPIVKQKMLQKEKDHIENCNPSCARCNNRKGMCSIESFRNEIQLQCERLVRDSNQYRLALDYGLITETAIPVKFYFEKFAEAHAAEVVHDLQLNN